MKVGDALSIFSHLINFVVFLYFITFLLRTNSFDTFGLLISAIGIFSSLVANIVSVLEG